MPKDFGCWSFWTVTAGRNTMQINSWCLWSLSNMLTSRDFALSLMFFAVHIFPRLWRVINVALSSNSVKKLLGVAKMGYLKALCPSCCSMYIDWRQMVRNDCRSCYLAMADITWSDDPQLPNFSVKCSAFPQSASISSVGQWSSNVHNLQFWKLQNYRL